MDSSHFVLIVTVLVLTTALVLTFLWHRKRTSSLAASHRQLVEKSQRTET